MGKKDRGIERLKRVPTDFNLAGTHHRAEGARLSEIAGEWLAGEARQR